MGDLFCNLVHLNGRAGMANLQRLPNRAKTTFTQLPVVAVVCMEATEVPSILRRCLHNMVHNW